MVAIAERPAAGGVAVVHPALSHRPGTDAEDDRQGPCPEGDARTGHRHSSMRPVGDCELRALR